MNFISRNTQLARATIIFSVLSVIACLILIVTQAMNGLQPEKDLSDFSMLTANPGLATLQTSAAGLFYLFATTQSILFTIWFYRIYRNLKYISPADKKFPAWLAAISWLIPVVNMVLPFLATHHARKAYNRVLPATGELRHAAVINIWWALFALLEIASAFDNFFSSQLAPVNHVSISMYIELINEIITIAGTTLSIIIIYRINNLENIFRTIDHRDENSIFSQISPSSAQSFD